MKRKTSIFFVLIATCLLVAHAALPHHHHNKIPVALINAFDHDAEKHFDLQHNHHRDTDATSHHHDNGDEECFASEAQLPSALKALTAIITPHSDYKHLLGGAVKAIVDGANLASTIHLFLNSHYFRHKPYLAHLHTTIVAHATGLRAPPIC